MPKVTKIPATINPLTGLPTTSLRKRRVAGYARVSTDKDEQFTSYEAQIDYYTQYIKSNPEWEFVRVYTDEGISGLNTKNRNGFNEMISDALGGAIDLIVTKSISRFARNTVDSLTAVRKLKEHGTEVYFEKEGIYTFDSKGELLITIMSSLAQEESRSISENVTWGQRKRFADGKVSMPYKRFLGYEKGPDGKPVIVESEAETVRLIFALYLTGKSAKTICKHLEREGIKSPGGKDKWSPTTVESILRNVKYKGDALLQKRFTVDFLTKTMKVNEGEVPQYYVEDSHPGIIPKEEFDMVQAEIARRQRMGRTYSGTSLFSAKLVCGDCGAYYGRKIWHSTDKSRRAVWQCNRKFSKDKEKCVTPTLSEDSIRNAFITAYSQLTKHREIAIADCAVLLDMVTDCRAIDEKITALNEEIAVVAEMVKSYIKENATTALSQEDYAKRYDSLNARYENASSKLAELQKEKESKQLRGVELRCFLDALRDAPTVLDDFDCRLWTMLVEKVMVFRDGRMTFRFKDGQEIEVGA